MFYKAVDKGDSWQFNLTKVWLYKDELYRHHKVLVKLAKFQLKSY